MPEQEFTPPLDLGYEPSDEDLQRVLDEGLPNQIYEPTEICHCGHPGSAHGRMETHGWKPTFVVDSGCLECNKGIESGCIQFGKRSESGVFRFKLSAETKTAILDLVAKKLMPSKENECPQ